MLMLFSVTYALPMVTSIIYDDGLLIDFVYAAVICVGAGAVVYGATLRHRRELRSRDGFLLVTLAWVFMSAIATVPLHDRACPASASPTRSSRRCRVSARPGRRC